MSVSYLKLAVVLVYANYISPSESVDQLIAVEVHALRSLNKKSSANDAQYQHDGESKQSQAVDNMKAEQDNTHEESDSADRTGPQQQTFLLRSVKKSSGWDIVILAMVALLVAFFATFFVSQKDFLQNYLSSKWSGFDADVLESETSDHCESLRADLNTNVMIVTLLLGITVNMSLPLPSPCDGVNILGTCAANQIAIEVQLTADVACSLLCIISMLIGGQLIIDLGRVPAEQAKTFIIDALPALGAKNMAFEFAVWAFTLQMIIHILVVLKPPQAIGCLALLGVGTAGTLSAKKISNAAAEKAVVLAGTHLKSDAK